MQVATLASATHAVLVVLALSHLSAGRLGWLLDFVASVPMPILAAERFAARTPDLDAVDASPLVGPAVPRSSDATVLDGDVVIKDQIDVAGLPTGVGRAGDAEIAERDATLVARIIAAGGRVIGKAKMTELGIDGLGPVMHYPMPPNPRAPGYSPGGSSTGTAVAVASGLARYGVGGDGLGSIRIPAAFCGLVGLKPSRERVPRDGIRSPVRTLDAVGPIARTAADCARLWQVMAGESIAPVTPWLPTRVGVPWRRLRMHPSRAVALAFDRMLSTLGIEGVDVELAGLDRATFLGGLIGAYEMSTGPMADAPRTKAGHTSQWLGRSMTAATADRLYARRDELRRSTQRALDTTPVLAFPTTAIPPPAITRRLVERGAEIMLLRALGAYTPLANLCDLPGIAIPAGVDERGRPLSVMFIAGRGGESTLLQIAAAAEQADLGAQPIA